jgi:hypothetical protein
VKPTIRVLMSAVEMGTNKAAERLHHVAVSRAIADLERAPRSPA